MLTDVQREAIARANALLTDAGLGPITPPTASTSTPVSLSSIRPLSPAPSQPYAAPAARAFSSTEIRDGLNIISRQLTVSALVEHPTGVIVEYPQSGSTIADSVAHRFPIDPCNFIHPKANIQYSLGGPRGSESDVTCGKLLCNPDGKPANCEKLKSGCKGLKICEKYCPSVPPRPLVPSARAQVFEKTLAFFCAASSVQCTVGQGSDLEDDYGGSDNYEENDGRLAASSAKRCTGKLVLKYDQNGRRRLQCEYTTSLQGTTHLVLRNLQEFDLDYLTALFNNDIPSIGSFERHASNSGYGPLAPCTFTASPSEQKQCCPYWHRGSDGVLQQGELRLTSACKVRFSIYTPYDLLACPFVVIVSRVQHSHPDPYPVKTPPPIINTLDELLLELDWKLADATPRKIMLDSGFVSGLRRQLGWSQLIDPCLSDLHPSLGNMDHVRRHIAQLRQHYFPSGTDFEGALHLVQQHARLPPSVQYLRCVESHILEDGATFYLVICMSKEMSEHLLDALHLTIDTSFKRVHGKWQEFEMETWNSTGLKSFVGARAFTTSQSAHAHLILFTRIFDIAQADTGRPVRFHHIHGSGFRTWIADSHRGQALGLGMYCQLLCHHLDTYCFFERSRLLRSLTPYEHLLRFLRLCHVHFKRNIHEIRNAITPEVYSAMSSLASTEALPDYEGVCEVIRQGGHKAKAWLKDKIEAKFVIPAVYHQKSLIPLEFWLASPSSTNGNEQAHRSINRDGIDLTLLGGIMRGMQYDFRVLSSISLHQNYGIFSRDRLATDYRRSQVAISRQVAVQTRVANKAGEKPPKTRRKRAPKAIPKSQDSKASSAPLGADWSLLMRQPSGSQTHSMQQEQYCTTMLACSPEGVEPFFTPSTGIGPSFSLDHVLSESEAYFPSALQYADYFPPQLSSIGSELTWNSSYSAPLDPSLHHHQTPPQYLLQDGTFSQPQLPAVYASEDAGHEFNSTDSAQYAYGAPVDADSGEDGDAVFNSRTRFASYFNSLDGFESLPLMPEFHSQHYNQTQF